MEETSCPPPDIKSDYHADLTVSNRITIMPKKSANVDSNDGLPYSRKNTLHEAAAMQRVGMGPQCDDPVGRQVQPPNINVTHDVDDACVHPSDTQAPSETDVEDVEI
ncbi:uncharacterized protein NECHADRAFT_82627 [Fusarium vanettenii 77-13-4]|uniref:Uncharacterized protein n=1 Tax=Fusarium vanettenii (strain ATCC MYA-4622 / CBS 123669 / FGSC 9596 / NRRL 45880 / 77-13-4) TaxID=660122 RepID=C7YXS0_FUSV7|nr:uncharacterized protein NECHADRAFT_82627 [Fusarium vanettenii 77-13-4]EEU43393.1 predicted protein [Fusarium vanettenii 77-13-4]